jgi:hypothetical protein
MPFPRYVSSLRIWLIAMWPKITASSEPSQKSHTIPNTSEATAKPLTRSTCGAAG